MGESEQQERPDASAPQYTRSLHYQAAHRDDLQRSAHVHYGGFHEMARQYPEHAEEAKRLLEAAMKDESPSVKARLRNLSRK